MKKSRRLKRMPKQKRPKDHGVLLDDEDILYADVCYPRAEKCDGIKETPTLRKIMNLLRFYDISNGVPDEIGPEEVCKTCGISLSTYKRLLSILEDYCSRSYIDGFEKRSASYRKYIALLKLFDWLDESVDMQAFCSEFHISRTTFFRYLAIVENYDMLFKRAVALRSDGTYCHIDPQEWLHCEIIRYPKKKKSSPKNHCSR